MDSTPGRMAGEIAGRSRILMATDHLAELTAYELDYLLGVLSVTAPDAVIAAAHQVTARRPAAAPPEAPGA
jgi:hypothetical protein